MLIVLIWRCKQKNMVWETGDKIMLRLIAIVIILTLCSSCYNFKPRVGSPWAQKLLTQGPKNASATFQKGWIDGCETGISTTSNDLQRHFYKWQQDPELAQNDEYYTAWR